MRSRGKGWRQIALLLLLAVFPVWSAENVPVLLWGKSQESLTNILKSDKSKVECPLALGEVLERVAAEQTGSTPLTLLFLEEDMDTADFLKASGAFDGSKQSYSSLFAPTPRDYFRAQAEYVCPMTVAEFKASLKHLERPDATDGQEPDKVVYLVTDPAQVNAAEWGDHIRVLSFANALHRIQEDPPKETVAVFDMRLYKSAAMSGGEYILQYLQNLTRDHIAVFSSLSTSSMRFRSLSKGEEESTAVNLRIFPWQLCAVLTLGFTFFLFTAMLMCMVNIDTATVFETKTLYLAKEY